MEDSPMIGAQIWLESDQSAEEIEMTFASFAAEKLSLARLAIPWRTVEPRPDEWDFALYDAAFEVASRYQVKIAATLTAQSPPPHRRQALAIKSGKLPSTRQALAQADLYIEKVVQRYRDHPALSTWIVMNEPGMPPQESPLATEEFLRWLQTQYTSIDELNQAWGSWYGSFDEVAPPGEEPQTSRSYQRFVDWRRFYRHFLAWHMKALAESVRRYDPHTPTHINPHGLLYNPISRSLDLPLLAETVDCLGASCHPSWHFTEEMLHYSEVGVGTICDIIRPAAAPRPYWITELQGGTNYFSGHHPICPTGKMIERWLWELVFAGVKAAIFWIWKAHSKEFEGGEWGLTDLQGGPTERSRAAGRVAAVIEENHELFASAKPAPSRVALLSDLDTHTLLLREARLQGRDIDAGMNAIFRYARALRRLGLTHDIVTTGSEKPLPLDQYRLLIAPNLFAISEETAQLLRAAVEHGAHLWVDGLFGLKSPTGRISQPVPAHLADVFGAEMLEFRKIDKVLEIKIGDQPVSAPGMVAILKCTSAKPLGAWNGLTIAATNQFAKGITTWVGLTLSEGEEKAVHEAVSGLLRPYAEDLLAEVPLAEMEPSDLLTRVMDAGDKKLILVMNPGDEPRPSPAFAERRILAASEGTTPNRLAPGGWLIAVL